MILGYCGAGAWHATARIKAQKHRLAAIGAQEFFCDTSVVPGAAPQLERAIARAGKGDVIAVTRPYRIAYSTRGVLALVERLSRKGAGLRILGTPVDTGTTTGRMIFASTPRWSLGISPLRAALRDLAWGWRDRQSPH